MAAQQSLSVADTETGASPADGPGLPAQPGPQPGTPKTSRAGRNLPAAIAVGALLAGMLVTVLLVAPHLWVVVLAVATPIATHEVTRRLREAGYDVPFLPLLLGGQAMVWLSWPFGVAGVLGAFGGTVVVCMVWRLLGQGLSHTPVNYLRDMSATVLLAVWVPLFMSFGALLIYPADGAGRVFCLLASVVCSDVGGYTAGVLFGKHPMAAAISPKKSWEGFAGSLLFGLTGAVLAVTFLLPDKPWWVGLPLGLLLVTVGTLGDLVESQVKRDLGIKDMGTMLPGHGGLMDRLDGLLPAAATTWIVLTVLS
ncbi:phosphatidate cytidylyltransferase [Mycobacterium talmoniae]|uniref:Phosphatidate cytidylyltransferase n=1 Tax=Mycobacterium talmoniae TaxID=1858794 RepID=A0A2S8BKC3_9MYCO|nr:MULTISPECIES: phosphatidate cytidylyltransferase [Mycobacterium]PQM47127.1 Phosphatidate cytidylyltransferase [Mycobacterium talmoniae]TDH50213.1 phosphatidate cytidylyltransferase [Mycobacterium eburneum]